MQQRKRKTLFHLSPLQAALWYYCWCRCRKHSVSGVATASLAAVQSKTTTIRIHIWSRNPDLSAMKRQSKTPTCINK